MLTFLMKCQKLHDAYVRDEITVYAAQASFFIVLSSFPFIMILLTVIQMIPSVSQTDLLLILSELMPAEAYPVVESVIFDLYTNSPAAILSATTVATLWSASRGMLGIGHGLNRIDGCSEHRGYIVSRLINSGYTIVFILVCILSMILMVFGSTLQNLLLSYFPFLAGITTYLISLRSLIALAILVCFFIILYTYLPQKPKSLKAQVPGAFFSTAGWMACSYGFSIYFNHFKRFSYMYGSLAAVVILMLWVYFCICILFLGAEINRHWEK